MYPFAPIIVAMYEWMYVCMHGSKEFLTRCETIQARGQSNFIQNSNGGGIFGKQRKITARNIIVVLLCGGPEIVFPFF